MPWFSHKYVNIPRKEIESLCERLLDEARERLNCAFRRVLLLPPDLTRAHCGAGWITETIFKLLPKTCDTHVIPTLGQHVPHTEAENHRMFGDIPKERIHAHDWLKGVTRLGVIPADMVAESTQGKARWQIPIDLNTMTVAEKWDLIVHIGLVVPHEVLGFSSHNKNYFIGLGGKDTICASHLAAAAYGIENNLGSLVTPLRACFNWAEARFLSHLPDVYMLLVMRQDVNGELVHSGVFVGDDWETYLAAAQTSLAQNLTLFGKPVKKMVTMMQADEFRSTWVANKAVYRTRMAMADGGELLIIAPGVERFGEQPRVDALIRKYGYCGTPHLLKHYRRSAALKNLAHGTAHLMHGSSEGRFTIRYAPGKLSREEIESVHYAHADLDETLRRYDPVIMRDGWNVMPDGEKVYFISSPSSGLWATREKLQSRLTRPAESASCGEKQAAPRPRANSRYETTHPAA
jgi:nickel-dependent lactate racemase